MSLELDLVQRDRSKGSVMSIEDSISRMKMDAVQDKLVELLRDKREWEAERSKVEAKLVEEIANRESWQRKAERLQGRMSFSEGSGSTQVVPQMNTAQALRYQELEGTINQMKEKIANLEAEKASLHKLIQARNRFGCWLCNKHAAEGDDSAEEEVDERELLRQDLDSMKKELQEKEQKRRRRSVEAGMLRSQLKDVKSWLDKNPEMGLGAMMSGLEDDPLPTLSTMTTSNQAATASPGEAGVKFKFPVPKPSPPLSLAVKGLKPALKQPGSTPRSPGLRVAFQKRGTEGEGWSQDGSEEEEEPEPEMQEVEIEQDAYMRPVRKRTTTPFIDRSAAVNLQPNQEPESPTSPTEEAARFLLDVDLMGEEENFSVMREVGDSERPSAGDEQKESGSSECKTGSEPVGEPQTVTFAETSEQVGYSEVVTKGPLKDVRERIHTPIIKASELSTAIGQLHLKVPEREKDDGAQPQQAKRPAAVHLKQPHDPKHVVFKPIGLVVASSSVERKEPLRPSRDHISTPVVTTQQLEAMGPEFALKDQEVAFDLKHTSVLTSNEMPGGHYRSCRDRVGTPIMLRSELHSIFPAEFREEELGSITDPHVAFAVTSEQVGYSEVATKGPLKDVRERIHTPIIKASELSTAIGQLHLKRPEKEEDEEQGPLSQLKDKSRKSMSNSAAVNFNEVPRRTSTLSLEDAMEEIRRGVHPLDENTSQSILGRHSGAAEGSRRGSGQAEIGEKGEGGSSRRGSKVSFAEGTEDVSASGRRSSKDHLVSAAQPTPEGPKSSKVVKVNSKIFVKDCASSEHSSVASGPKGGLTGGTYGLCSVAQRLNALRLARSTGKRRGSSLLAQDLKEANGDDRCPVVCFGDSEVVGSSEVKLDSEDALRSVRDRQVTPFFDEMVMRSTGMAYDENVDLREEAGGSRRVRRSRTKLFVGLR